ncbi:unnamed protein product [Lactuca saligna]|uniref:Uncharacterized protein n=1 Tax=Lactuca saligna TaxID=75948 RepID=A0AA35YUY2_LACSI|nr:unnamed protein product [Lactuca saligna]
MEAPGIGMMMVATAWEGQTLSEGHSSNNGHYGCVPLELPITDRTQPTTTPAGPNTLPEDYGGLEILKCFQQLPCCVQKKEWDEISWKHLQLQLKRED